MQRFCMNCGAELPENAGFCPKCGAKIELPHCPSCGKEIDYGTDFCIYCGQALRENSENQPSTVSAQPETDLRPESAPLDGQAAEKAIITPNQNNSESSTLEPDRPDDVLQQVEETIVSRTNLTASAREKKHPALRIIGIILVILVLIFAAISGFEEIYLRRMYPNKIMLNPDAIAYAQTEIGYHLAPEKYDITVEITGGNLEKRTSLPKYKNAVFTYLFVDYVYDITVSNGTESASGTVTVDASFEADPFNCKPNDILLNTFTYSDNLTDFAEGLIPPPETITPKDLIGRWELQYLKISETVLYDTLQQNIYF